MCSLQLRFLQHIRRLAKVEGSEKCVAGMLVNSLFAGVMLEGSSKAGWLHHTFVSSAAGVPVASRFWYDPVPKSQMNLSPFPSSIRKPEDT